MQRRPLDRFGLTAICAVGAVVAGCMPHKDAVMGGNADGVSIQFVGDARETLPLAEKHCAQYERVPQLRDTYNEIVNYACIRR